MKMSKKLQAGLARRRDGNDGVSEPRRQQGNHQMHVPGSQNRKKVNRMLDALGQCSDAVRMLLVVMTPHVLA